MSVRTSLLFSVIALALVSLVLFIHNEITSHHHNGSGSRFVMKILQRVESFKPESVIIHHSSPDTARDREIHNTPSKPIVLEFTDIDGADASELVEMEPRVGKHSTTVKLPTKTSFSGGKNSSVTNELSNWKSAAVKSNHTSPSKTEVRVNTTKQEQRKPAAPVQEQERRGTLVCDGKEVYSEIIYWKIVPGDKTYESPITPHHSNHHDKYLTFEYDNGGWNNVRMSLECLIVVAHATGRTLVIPPQQHLYLLGKTHKDKHDQAPHDEMGFEDFFDIERLKTQEGFHMIMMKEFLEKEAVPGGLNPSRMRLKNNDTSIWGDKLWNYLRRVADENPAWTGRYMVFPDRPGDFDVSEKSHPHPGMRARLVRFANHRPMLYYNEDLQKAHHIHIRGDGEHRVLQHHYAFAFFADPTMQSFYKRFIRDYMRYKDYIQCAGAKMVKAVREDSLRVNPSAGGVYYALHVRRGDFQFKEVKISAAEIVHNLNISGPDGKQIIPPGSLVYLSTDDPDGLCLGCTVKGKFCNQIQSPKPPGCPEDTSWHAMEKFGWKLRFLKDYSAYLKDVNPNVFGMVESIVCSRAKVFAGTYYSTFTGYIHRLRGFHGLGEDTYYHHKDYVLDPRMKKSVGNGFPREWRAGWTDDGGGLIR